MKARTYLLSAFLFVQPLAHPAEQPATPAQKAEAAVQKLGEQCDDPDVPNKSEGMSCASKTELARRQSISDLKSLGGVGLATVRAASRSARGE